MDTMIIFTCAKGYGFMKVAATAPRTFFMAVNAEGCFFFPKKVGMRRAVTRMT